ncbi:MAG: hypothetical protein HY738_10315 [Bacteroidia bacterium]|nr:hypothetical protein [Bacteroidia bacterium]
MSVLVYNAEPESTFGQILQVIRCYMKGMAYEQIYVRCAGKTRFVMERTPLGYKAFGNVITADIIKKRYPESDTE